MITGGVAMHTGELLYTPWMFTPSFLGRAWLEKRFTNVTGNAAWGQFLTGALGGGIQFGGVNNYNLASSLNSLKTNEVRMARKAIRKAIRSTRWAAAGEEGVKRVLANVGSQLSNRPVFADNILRAITKAPNFARVINTSLFLSRMGSILFPITAAYTAGHAIGRTMELGFKAAVSALDYSAAQYEQIRALEFGGTLGAGYKTQEAATERQRAVQALQRTHLAGRRSLGMEAMNYHALV
jgi:hypothetical protein